MDEKNGEGACSSLFFFSCYTLAPSLVAKICMPPLRRRPRYRVDLMFIYLFPCPLQAYPTTSVV